MIKEEDKPTALDIDILDKVSTKFDHYKSFSDSGSKAFFDWMTPYSLPPEETIVLYAPATAVEYDMVRISRFTKFSKPKTDHFYTYTSFDYASKLAQIYANKTGSAFILKFEIKRSGLRDVDFHEINRGGGMLYMTDHSQMNKMHNSIIGKIELVEMIVPSTK